MKLTRFLNDRRAVALVSAAFGLLVMTTAGLVRYAEVAQRNIADSVLRFHVIANSDGYHDQQLKYKVRDGLIELLSPLCENCADIDEARVLLRQNLANIAMTAESIAEAEGYAYKVRAEIAADTFPTKEYEGASFPAGVYEALRVVIGDGAGQNWWCVMFPPMCVAEANATFGDESAAKLKHLLLEEERGLVFSRSKSVSYKARFKIVEIWQRIKGGNLS